MSAQERSWADRYASSTRPFSTSLLAGMSGGAIVRVPSEFGSDSSRARRTCRRFVEEGSAADVTSPLRDAVLCSPSLLAGVNGHSLPVRGEASAAVCSSGEDPQSPDSGR